MSQDDDRSMLLTIFAGIGIGAVVGAVTGILLAPKAGNETRQDLAHTLDTLKDNLADLSNKIKPALENVAATVRSSARAAADEPAADAPAPAAETTEA